MIIAKHYRVGSRIWLRVPLIVSLFGSELFIICRFEVSVRLLLEVMVVGSHSVFALLSVLQSVRGYLFFVVVVLVGCGRLIRVI